MMDQCGTFPIQLVEGLYTCPKQYGFVPWLNVQTSIHTFANFCHELIQSIPEEGVKEDYTQNKNCIHEQENVQN